MGPSWAGPEDLAVASLAPAVDVAASLSYSSFVAAAVQTEDSFAASSAVVAFSAAAVSFAAGVGTAACAVAAFGSVVAEVQVL